MIRLCRVTLPKRQISAESSGFRDMAVGVTFLEIVDFDVVNATILIALFRLSNIFASKKFSLYISKEKSFVLYVSRLLRLRECRATDTKK